MRAKQLGIGTSSPTDDAVVGAALLEGSQAPRGHADDADCIRVFAAPGTVCKGDTINSGTVAVGPGDSRPSARPAHGPQTKAHLHRHVEQVGEHRGGLTDRSQQLDFQMVTAAAKTLAGSRKAA
jgi:hypothetical protein